MTPSAAAPMPSGEKRIQPSSLQENRSSSQQEHSSSQDDITSSETGHPPHQAADSVQGAKACTTCGATETPMWRNGACGPKTLCNACGVKYQRRMHKQKVAADLAAAEAAAPAAGAAEQQDGSGRLHRSGSGALRPRTHDSPPTLTRRSCTKEPKVSGSREPSPADGAMASQQRQQQPGSSEDSKVRKARRLTSQPSTRTAPAHRRPAAGGQASAAATFPAGTATRLDGLQMQMTGRGGVSISIPHVTVLLQPVTRAQALWTNASSPAPSVALCAYDSTGSFLAAAPNVPDPAVAWTYPTSQTAAWSSGHGWSLLFVQQRQHDAFRGLLLDWQIATKARQAQSSEGHSSEESGASAETDTSRHTFQSGASHLRPHLKQQRSQARGASRKRTVNCIRAVSDSIPIRGAAPAPAAAASAPAGERALRAASPKRPCSARSRPARTSSLPPSSPATTAALSGGLSQQDGNLGHVSEEGRDCLSPVELEMAATIGSPDSEPAPLQTSGSSRQLACSESSVRGGSALGVHIAASGNGFTNPGQKLLGLSAPPVALLNASPGGGGPSPMVASGAGGSQQLTFMMSMGSGDWGAAVSQPYGSLGDSEASAATGFTQLSRRFGSMHVASSDSLSDLAFSRGACPSYPSDRSYNDGSSHNGRRRGRGRSPPSSVDTEGRVRSGQLQHGTSFASMSAVAPSGSSAMMCMPSSALSNGSGGGRGCSSLLQELHTEMDPLDPRFLAQVTAPSEGAVRGGSAAHALLHPTEDLLSFPASAPAGSASFPIDTSCSAGFAAPHSHGFHLEDHSQHEPLLGSDGVAAMDADWLQPTSAPPPLTADMDVFEQQQQPPLARKPDETWSAPPLLGRQGGYQPTALQQQLAHSQSPQRHALSPPPQIASVGTAPPPLPPLHPNGQDAGAAFFADDPAIADILSECSGWLLDSDEGLTAVHKSGLVSMAPSHVQPGSGAAAEWEATTARLAATIQEDTQALWIPPCHHNTEDTAGPWAPQHRVPAQ